MEMQTTQEVAATTVRQTNLPIYEVPFVTTIDNELVLEELGPAQANEYGGPTWTMEI